MHLCTVTPHMCRISGGSSPSEVESTCVVRLLANSLNLTFVSFIFTEGGPAYTLGASLQLDHRFLSDHPQHEPRASEKYALTRGIPSSRQQQTPDPEPTVGEYSSPHTESLWLLRGGLDGLLLVPAGFLGDLQQLCGSYELEAWEEYVFFIQYATPAFENSPRPVSICIFLNQLFHSWRDLKANRCASDLRAALFLEEKLGGNYRLIILKSLFNLNELTQAETFYMPCC